MPNILFTNVKVNGKPAGEDPNGDDVMVFTNLPAETLKRAYAVEGSISFDDCYAVPDRDLQYYLYEPSHLSEKEEARARELAAQYKPPE